MSYEFVGLASAAISSVVLLAGLYYALRVGRKTSKATVLWSLMAFFCLLLFLNQIAEVFELAVPESGPEGGDVEGSPANSFGEDMEYTTLVASSAVLVAISFVIRRSLVVPV